MLHRDAFQPSNFGAKALRIAPAIAAWTFEASGMVGGTAGDSPESHCGVGHGGCLFLGVTGADPGWRSPSRDEMIHPLHKTGQRTP